MTVPPSAAAGRDRSETSTERNTGTSPEAPLFYRNDDNKKKTRFYQKEGSGVKTIRGGGEREVGGKDPDFPGRLPKLLKIAKSH